VALFPLLGVSAAGTAARAPVGLVSGGGISGGGDGGGPRIRAAPDRIWWPTQLGGGVRFSGDVKKGSGCSVLGDSLGRLRPQTAASGGSFGGHGHYPRLPADDCGRVGSGGGRRR
jgi:hypothetical protein